MFGWSTRWSLLTAIGLVIAAYAGRDPVANWRITRSWVEASCTMTESSVQPLAPWMRSGSALARLRYTFDRDGRQHSGQRYHLTIPTASKDVASVQRLVDAFPVGSAQRCWVNPVDPSQSVLSRATPTGAVVGLAAGLGLMVFALYKFVRLMTPMGQRLVRPEYLDGIEGKVSPPRPSGGCE